MATKKVGSVAKASKASRPVRNRKEEAHLVSVWSGASITVNIGDFNSIKFEHGFETWARDDPRRVAQAEQRIFETCEKIVQKRARKLKKIVMELQDG